MHGRRKVLPPHVASGIQAYTSHYREIAGISGEKDIVSTAFTQSYARGDEQGDDENISPSDNDDSDDDTPNGDENNNGNDIATKRIATAPSTSNVRKERLLPTPSRLSANSTSATINITPTESSVQHANNGRARPPDRLKLRRQTTSSTRDYTDMLDGLCEIETDLSAFQLKGRRLFSKILVTQWWRRDFVWSHRRNRCRGRPNPQTPNSPTWFLERPFAPYATMPGVQQLIKNDPRTNRLIETLDPFVSLGDIPLRAPRHTPVVWRTFFEYKGFSVLDMFTRDEEDIYVDVEEEEAEARNLVRNHKPTDTLRIVVSNYELTDMTGSRFIFFVCIETTAARNIDEAEGEGDSSSDPDMPQEQPTPQQIASNKRKAKSSKKKRFAAEMAHKDVVWIYSNHFVVFLDGEDPNNREFTIVAEDNPINDLLGQESDPDDEPLYEQPDLN